MQIAVISLQNAYTRDSAGPRRSPSPLACLRSRCTSLLIDRCGCAFGCLGRWLLAAPAAGLMEPLERRA